MTRAAITGVRDFVIMRPTAHKTHTTLRIYIHLEDFFREKVAAGLGI
jgi:hypothetical protein